MASRRTSLPGKLGIVLVTLCVLVLVGELGARIYYRVTRGVGLVASLAPRDPFIGWEGSPVFGDPRSTRYKIFVIGDSMTAAVEVKPAERYHALLGRVLDAEVFAYGGSGYGTLQELMVLDRHLAWIRPDLVLLQTTSNDFVNNSWELERSSYFNTNLQPRPYLRSSRVEILYPGRFQLVAPLVQHSRLAFAVNLHLTHIGTRLVLAGKLRTAEQDMIDRGMDLPAFRDSVATTEGLVATMKHVAGKTAFVAFAADAPWLEEWRGVCRRREIAFVDTVPDRILAEERKGAQLRYDGAHWTPAGHRLVADTLAPAVALKLQQSR